MKKKVFSKVISLLLVVATLLTTLPFTVFADEIKGEESGSDNSEVYIKEMKLVQAKTREEAKAKLELSGYAFLDGNLNEGTGEDGIWLGFKTTSDPMEAIYDLKVMNMKGGFTRSSMEEALANQESAITVMAEDLKYLIDEFIEAYESESAPALSAYKALNFFRVVAGETKLLEENGLGYQIISGGMSLSRIKEIILFCDPNVVDSIVKLLTMGIQKVGDNWIGELSALGAYDEDVEYMEDEAELNRRALQLLSVLQMYSELYNTMEKSGLMPDELDENFNPIYKTEDTEEEGAEQEGAEQEGAEQEGTEQEGAEQEGTEQEGTEQEGTEPKGELTASEADLQKADASRYKFYKLAVDELEKYSYGDNGKTLKDFFASLARENDETALYPMVSVLSDGQFSALSYGCFLEMVIGVNATAEDFSAYDELYTTLTEEMASIYLYMGVDKALFEDEAIVGFTETAQRHIASTGETNFFEKENTDERIWDEGLRVVKGIGVGCLAVLGLTKITVGVVSIVAAVTATKSAAVATTIKYGAMIGGLKGLLVAVVIVALSVLISYLHALRMAAKEDEIDWEKNPMLQYMYDVKEASFMQASESGVGTEFMTRSVFKLYEAVTDLDGYLVDLNAHSGASQWIQLFVSYDRQGVNAKPIKLESESEAIRVQKGIGETPEGYMPVTRFGEVNAYDLNQWDKTDEVDGLYLFYKQDEEIAVDDGRTYYISEVQLQTGKSPAHCIDLLRDAGYTPINVNLSPDLTDDDFMFEDKIYTYLGYKTTTSEDSAIRDIRLVYGPGQGTIQYGAAGYAECGSNGKVTLYATKYAIAGTPLLAGGLICVDKQSKAPAGYEPVCLMSGGPAVPVNVDNNGEVRAENGFLYLYFLPKVTFTSGKTYLGGIAAFTNPPDLCGSDQVSNLEDAKELWSSYVPAAGIKLGAIDSQDRYIYSIYFYPTYNPYRAIYDVKAAVLWYDQTVSKTIILEGTSYYAWNVISWGYDWSKASEDKDSDELSIHTDVTTTVRPTDIGDRQNVAFYLAGNTTLGNTYDAKAGQMTKAQPIEISQIKVYNIHTGYHKSIPDGFYPVVNAFSNDLDIPVGYWLGGASFAIYTQKKNEERPYVSNVFVVDDFTLYRAYGGEEKGVSLDQITDSMKYSYLVSLGATDILSSSAFRIASNNSLYAMLNVYKSFAQFGFSRTAKNNQALRDMFLYVDEFSTDEPPKELYRGSVKYTLLTQIPYNLLSDADAPQMGVYLYGTTSSKAGSRIIDFQVSHSPFMEGYETIRTMGGRSLASELCDYAEKQKNMNPIEAAKAFFDQLLGFFNNDDKIRQTPFFYLHVKREDANDKRELYIEKLYLASVNLDKATAIDRLFDQGAEGYVNLDLNSGAGGKFVYVGYSRTSDTSKALTEIRAYHQKNPPSTLTDDDGHVFELVNDIDLNLDAGGDYIYLYTAKDSSWNYPIIDISAGFKVVTGSEYKRWDSMPGYFATHTYHCTKQWDSRKNSDLNKGAGGEYVYLMYTTIGQTHITTPEQELNYGADKTYTRNDYKNKNPNGKYVGGLYVMDKETIRLEKIASGELSASAKCSDVRDQEVIDRLTKMGATTILDTPILVNVGGYFEGNTNKVFIGYSRTDKSASAIRNIAIKAEIMSKDEPKASIEVGGKGFNLVAEAAKKVTELPKAINLIGIENGASMHLPRLYLYYSTATGSDPIYDITIDDIPVINGYNTVRSANLMDAFTDVHQQARDLSDQVDGDTLLSKSEEVYKEELVDWMDEIADLFDPEDVEAKPFYIHVKRHDAESLEEIKPYIGKIFIAAGDTKHEALASLVALEPDGFIEVDLNQGAGGDYVYLAYKRVAKSKDALTDVAVFEGKKFEPSQRITINGESIKYTLVDDIDLNLDAGGKYLYLYATDDKDAGNPITSLNIKEQTDSYLKCGVERVTVRRAEGDQYTDESIDLNKEAGGSYLYLVMTRETTEGHTSNNVVTDERLTEATCTEDGCRIEITACVDCSAKMEIVAEVLEAHGNHFDDEEDGDHDCDECGKRNVGGHTIGGYIENDPDNPDNPGGLKFVRRCSDCGEPTGEEYPITESKTYKWDTGSASLFGNGSVIAVITLALAAGIVALIIYLRRKKTITNNKGEDEK